MGGAGTAVGEDPPEPDPLERVGILVAAGRVGVLVGVGVGSMGIVTAISTCSRFPPTNSTTLAATQPWMRSFKEMFNQVPFLLRPRTSASCSETRYPTILKDVFGPDRMFIDGNVARKRRLSGA